MAIVAAVLLASCAPTARGDACADFLAAQAAWTSAGEALTAYSDRHPVDAQDFSPEGRAWREVYMTLAQSLNRTADAIYKAENALRESIANPDVAATVNAIAEVRRARDEASSALSRWIPPFGEGSDLQSWFNINWHLEEIGASAGAGLRETLKTACRLGRLNERHPDRTRVEYGRGALTVIRR